MMDFLLYDGKVALALLVFYLFYRFLLKKETFHRFNRVVLVGTAVLSFLLPLCIITIHKPIEAAPVVPEPTIVATELPAQELVPLLEPAVPCGLLYEAALIRPWEYARILGMDAIHPHYSELLLSAGECAAAHEAGLKVNTWTVNTPEDMDAVLRAGADILITNYPDQALKRATRG